MPCSNISNSLERNIGSQPPCWKGWRGRARDSIANSEPCEELSSSENASSRRSVVLGSKQPMEMVIPAVKSESVGAKLTERLLQRDVQRFPAVAASGGNPGATFARK